MSRHFPASPAPSSGGVTILTDLTPERAGWGFTGLLVIAVALGALRGEEPHQRLPHGKPRCHDILLAGPIGSLWSTCWSFHCSRTQECAGSSQISHSRLPGPAIAFR